MKLPISKRLLCCASLVPQGARVADVGCDHGYLSIHLLREHIAATVAAMDLRPGASGGGPPERRPVSDSGSNGIFSL